MALYRCAACGSSKVIIEKKEVKKSLFGRLFGGKDKSVKEDDINEMFKCSECGNVSEKPMPEEMKYLIDAGVDNLSARNNLVLNGEKIAWETIKNKYKNIESGNADAELFQIEMKKKEEERRNAAEYKVQLISEYKSKGAYNDKVAEILADMKIAGKSEESIAATMENLNKAHMELDEAKKKAEASKADLIACLMEDEGLTKKEAEQLYAALKAQFK